MQDYYERQPQPPTGFIPGGPPFGPPLGGPPFGEPMGGPPFGPPTGGPPFGPPTGGPPFGPPMGGPPFGPPMGGPPFGPPGRPPFGPPPGGPPFGPPFGGGPFGFGPPSGPPPAFFPSQAAAQQTFGILAVNPGAIRPCIFRFVFIWLDNGDAFWTFLVFVGPTSVAGWRWIGFRWVFFGIDIRRIAAFACF